MLRVLQLCLVLCAIWSTLGHPLLSNDDEEQTELEQFLLKEFTDYIKTGHRSQELESALKHFQFPGVFRYGYQQDPKSLAECIACKSVVGAIISARKVLGASREALAKVAIETCITLKLETEVHCGPIIENQIDTILYIVDNKKDPELTSARFCAILLQDKNCKDRSRKDWVIEIPPRPAAVSESFRNPPSLETPYKTLQITDLHYDKDYTVGSNAACSGELCCIPGSIPLKPEDAAGQWGDYRGCDTSWDLFNDSLHQMAHRHQLDTVMFTGDIIDHKVWSTSPKRNSDIITEFYGHIKQVFKGVQILPLVGNHEPHPVNVFSHEDAGNVEITTQWVFDLLADLWADILPAETRSTILKGGYYTLLLRPGLRIVAINSNVCYTFNWWLLYDDYDQYGQLRWLVQVLSEAEKNGEAVHIISHIPSGSTDCLQNWSKEYSKIVRRFADTIVAQFNGHTHHLTHSLFFDQDDGMPVNVAFNGGSLTPYKHVNPNYVIYDIDRVSHEVLDMDLWTFNLTEANLTPELSPRWFKLYSFKEAYGVDNLRPAVLAELAERMAKSKDLSNLYYRHKYREADTSLMYGCNNDCYVNNLCDMVTSYYGDTRQCKILRDIWNSANPE